MSILSRIMKGRKKDTRWDTVKTILRGFIYILITIATLYLYHYQLGAVPFLFLSIFLFIEAMKEIYPSFQVVNLFKKNSKKRKHAESPLI